MDFIEDQVKFAKLQWKKFSFVHKFFIFFNMAAVLSMLTLAAGNFSADKEGCSAQCRVQVGRDVIFAGALSVFALSAIFQENVADLQSWIAMLIVYCCMALKLGFDILTEEEDGEEHPRKKTAYVSVVLSILGAIMGLTLFLFLNKRLGKNSSLAFYAVGSNQVLRACFNQFLRYKTALKMDAFIVLNFYANVVVWLYGSGETSGLLPECTHTEGPCAGNVAKASKIGIALATVALFLSWAWDLGSMKAVFEENRMLASGLAFTGLVLPCYAIYTAYHRRTQCCDMPFIISLMGLLMVRALFAAMFYLCWRNFNKGLKEKVLEKSAAELVSKPGAEGGEQGDVEMVNRKDTTGPSIPGGYLLMWVKDLYEVDPTKGSWEQRWFCLLRKQLMWFADSAATEVVGQCKLQGMSVTLGVAGKGLSADELERSLALISGTESIFLMAPDDKSLKKWMALLQERCQNVSKGGELDVARTKAHHSHGNSHAAGEEESEGAAATPAPAAGPPEQLDGNTRFVVLSGNRVDWYENQQAEDTMGGFDLEGTHFHKGAALEMASSAEDQARGLTVSLPDSTTYVFRAPTQESCASWAAAFRANGSTNEQQDDTKGVDKVSQAGSVSGGGWSQLFVSTDATCKACQKRIAGGSEAAFSRGLGVFHLECSELVKSGHYLDLQFGK